MEPRALEMGATSAGAHWPWSVNTGLGPSTMVIGGVTTHRVNRIPMSFFFDHITINPKYCLSDFFFSVKVIVISDFFLVWYR